MKPVSMILVLGGARSGKSRYAEQLALRTGRPVTYMATAGPPRDAEMAARITAHRARRPAHWVTKDVPHDLDAALRCASGLVMVDCLTLWLSNVMLDDRDVGEAIEPLLKALVERDGATVVVSNEVGEGIVPATPLGRRFRDWQGVLNQRVASAATDIVKLVAGCPIVVKPRQEPEPSL